MPSSGCLHASWHLPSYCLSAYHSIYLRTEIFGYLAAGSIDIQPSYYLNTWARKHIIYWSLYIIYISLSYQQMGSLLAVALGLVTITRFDGILFFIVTLLLIPTFGLRVRFAGIYLLCIAPWYIFSWIYLGSLLPDTLFIKIAQRSWGRWDFLNGLDLYYRVYHLRQPFHSCFFHSSYCFSTNK